MGGVRPDRRLCRHVWRQWGPYGHECCKCRAPGSYLRTEWRRALAFLLCSGFRARRGKAHRWHRRRGSLLVTYCVATRLWSLHHQGKGSRTYLQTPFWCLIEKELAHRKEPKA